MKNQSETLSRPNTHGGFREGAGRPRKNTREKVLRLTPENIAWLEHEAARRKEAGEKDVSHSSIAEEVISAARAARRRSSGR